MSSIAAIELHDRDHSTPLVSTQDQTVAAACAISDGQAILYSSRAPDSQAPNQDAAAVIPVDEQSGVLIVADGLGGERAGHDASELAVRSIAEAVREEGVNGSRLRSAILDGIETANRLILDMGIGAATTVAVVEINGGCVRPYHVGDSDILVVGGRGRLKLQTIAHSPVAMAVEAGMLDHAAAMHHDERHVVSNVVGSASMRIEIGPMLRLAPRDTVLVASDGLYDNLHLDEIATLIRKGPLKQSTQRLAAIAQERMHEPQDGAPHKPDDLTVITYRRDRRVR